MLCLMLTLSSRFSFKIVFWSRGNHKSREKLYFEKETSFIISMTAPTGQNRPIIRHTIRLHCWPPARDGWPATKIKSPIKKPSKHSFNNYLHGNFGIIILIIQLQSTYSIPTHSNKPVVIVLYRIFKGLQMSITSLNFNHRNRKWIESWRVGVRNERFQWENLPGQGIIQKRHFALKTFID